MIDTYNTWIEEVCCADESQHSELLIELINHVEDVIADAVKIEPPARLTVLQRLDELFVNTPTEKTPALFIIALLRSTFRARRALLQWNWFRDLAVIELEKRGENTKMLMAGLIDTSWDDQRCHT